MRSKIIENYKKKLKLNAKQKELIIGKLLGDGHLETQNKGQTYRFKIEHSINQKDYVDWLFEEFKDWTMTLPKIKICESQGKTYQKYWFNTISHSSFRFYAQQFYRDGKKVIPKLIHRWLTPLSLAVWFMDDGSLKSKFHRVRIINTQGFSKKDVLKLIKILELKFGLKSKLRKQAEGFQIMILAESADKFIQLIRSFILPSMLYKIKGLD